MSDQIESEHSRSLASRFLGIFRGSSSAGSSTSPNGRSVEGGGAQGHVENLESARRYLDSRAPLLGNYDRREPLCGSRSCNHGTFSPRPCSPESAQRFGCDGTNASLNEMVHDYSQSGAPSENDNASNKLKVSSSGQPLQNRKTLYV